MEGAARAWQRRRPSGSPQNRCFMWRRAEEDRELLAPSSTPWLGATPSNTGGCREYKCPSCMARFTLKASWQRHRHPVLARDSRVLVATRWSILTQAATWGVISTPTQSLVVCRRPIRRIAPPGHASTSCFDGHFLRSHQCANFLADLVRMVR